MGGSKRVVDERVELSRDALKALASDGVTAYGAAPEVPVIARTKRELARYVQIVPGAWLPHTKLRETLAATRNVQTSFVYVTAGGPESRLAALPSRKLIIGYRYDGGRGRLTFMLRSDAHLNRVVSRLRSVGAKI